jgi:hypothetical protein
METLNKDSASLEQFMHDTDELEQDPAVSHHFTKGAVVIIIALIVCMIVAVASIINFANGLEHDRQARQDAMNSIAAKIPAGAGWVEDSSSSPSLEKSKIFNKTWKTPATTDLDDVASRLGIPMSDMAYPAGCKEGNSGEFYIQVCSGDMGKTVSVIID